MSQNLKADQFSPERALALGRQTLRIEALRSTRWSAG